MSLALSNVFYYQNPNTNQPSTNAVSAKQLCRILCPANQNSKTTKTSSFLDQSTLVIAFDPIENTHDSNGWKPIHQVPLLKEACAFWYYEDNTITLLPTSSDIPSSDQTQTLPTTQGPVSTRDLALLYYNTQNNILNETRVWSAQASSDGWKAMRELPDLMNAMEAFEDCFDIDVNVHRNDNGHHNQNEETKEQTTTGQTETVWPKIDTETHADGEGDEIDLLDDFFSSIAQPGDNNHSDKLDQDEEEYESDGGTTYVKNMQSGEWINANNYAPSKKRKLQAQPQLQSHSKSAQEQKTKAAALVDMNKNTNKNKKPKFKARNAKCWVYVTNLPTTINEQELADYFKKAGVLDIDPNTLRDKVKLYRYNGGEKIQCASDASSTVQIAEEGMPKGDASVCYARPESVELALQLLDDSPFRTVDASGKFIADPQRISVQRAKFEMHGKEFKGRKKVSDVKRKVARLAKLQAVGWDDGENGRITGGLKGLRIIVLQNVFDALALRGIGETKEDAILKGIEKEIFETCSDHGTVEKITIVAKNRRNGVVIVKFSQPTAAGEAIQEFNGKIIRGKKIEASYWDGVTDFTVRNEEQETKNAEKRLDEFGNWLDNQELPEEFQLQVEGS